VSSTRLHPHPRYHQRHPLHAPGPRHGQASFSAASLGSSSATASSVPPQVDARQQEVDLCEGRSPRGQWRLPIGAGGGAVLDSSTTPRGGGRSCLIAPPHHAIKEKKPSGIGAVEEATCGVEPSFELRLVCPCIMLCAHAPHHTHALAPGPTTNQEGDGGGRGTTQRPPIMPTRRRSPLGLSGN
jgi:hypothetical protein